MQIGDRQKTAITPDEPAVLLIVASPSGTSAQVATQRHNVLLHNKHGRACGFVAEGARDGSGHRGSDPDAAMSADDAAGHKLLVIQVPLRTSRPLYPAIAAGAGAATAPPSPPPPSSGPAEPKGLWPSLARYRLERDPDAHIRILVQHYQTTETAAITASQLASMGSEVNALYDVGAPWNAGAASAGAAAVAVGGGAATTTTSAPAAGDGGGSGISDWSAFLTQPPATRPWVWGFWEPGEAVAGVASADATGTAGAAATVAARVP